MAKFPYLTPRKGSRNLYYKRDVDPSLAGDGRPKQIWRSLKTPDRKKAEKAYAAQHAEIELLFEQWRREDQQSAVSSDNAVVKPSASELPVTPLTPSLLRKLADTHYQNVFEADFKLRGELWAAVEKDPESFWRGDIIEHPKNDTQKLRGQEFSYYDYLMGEPELEPVFLYCLHMRRKKRLENLRRNYALGMTLEHETVARSLLVAQGVRLCGDDSITLGRKMIQSEMKAIQDIVARDETVFDAVNSAPETEVTSSTPQTTSCERMSVLVEKYVSDSAQERAWPKKTLLRKKAELAEFIELCGDKPANQYTQADGVAFRDAQGLLPASRLRQPFNGLSLRNVVAKAKAIATDGGQFPLLSPTTIADKVNTASGFFEWAKSRDSSVVNPVSTLKLKRGKKRAGKARYPFTTEELNNLFAAPVYTGCHSKARWHTAGSVVLEDSAIYWVPLIALFSACGDARA